MSAKLVEIEENLIQLRDTGRGQDDVRFAPKLAEKIGYLAAEVECSDFQPTTQQVAVHDELKEQAATYQQRFKLVLAHELADFNGLLRKQDIPNIMVSNMP